MVEPRTVSVRLGRLLHVKLNKEEKGEDGGAELVVRASDSEARVRVSLLTRFTMLCP